MYIYINNLFGEVMSSHNRPTAHQYSLLSQHVYGQEVKVGDIVPSDNTWIVKNVYTGRHGFFAAVYQHEQKKQRVVSFRGTNSFAAVWEDISGIIFNKTSAQKEEAYFLLDEVVRDAKQQEYHLSFTGHSLGAALASLSVFYCHRSLEYPAANAVTFENPGVREVMQALDSTLEKVNLDILDIINYLSYPNRINTFGLQVGSVYTTEPDIGSWGNLGGWFLKQAHSIDAIVKFFDFNNGKPKLFLMIDWPQGNQRDIFYKESDFQNGRYQKHQIIDDKSLEAVQQRFNLTYKGKFQYNPQWDNQTSLALRHFPEELQKFLVLFHGLLKDLSNDPSTHEKLVAQWKKEGMNEQISQYLLGFSLMSRTNGTLIIKLHPLPVETFPQNIQLFSQQLGAWIKQKGNQTSVIKLLQLTPEFANDPRLEILAQGVKSGAQLAGKITIERVIAIGAQDVPIDKFDDAFVNRMKSLHKKITATGISNNVKMDGNTVLHIPEVKAVGIVFASNASSASSSTILSKYETGVNKNDGVEDSKNKITDKKLHLSKL